MTHTTPEMARLAAALLDEFTAEFTAEKHYTGFIAVANALRSLADQLEIVTAERDALFNYYKTTREMLTTVGHPDATAEDERQTEEAYNKATDDVQRQQREAAAIAKEAK